MPCPTATGAILKRTFAKYSGSRGRRSESNFAAAGTLTSASGSNRLLKKGHAPYIPEFGGCRKTLPSQNPSSAKPGFAVGKLFSAACQFVRWLLAKNHLQYNFK